jgi:putative tryptophan/tyrosine transport system substrate-binding protein
VGGCALPFAAPPPAAKVHRIAYLTPGSLNPETTVLASAFRQGLADLGYVEGQNLLIEERYANGNDQLAEPAAELVRLQPEVIVVTSAQAARAVLAATPTIPIVSAGNGDLVARGLAASYARPGGTVTGLSTPELAGKRLQLLQEVVPTLSRVAVLSDTTSLEFSREPYEAAARTLGLQLQWVGTNVREGWEPGFDAVLRDHPDGLVLASGPAIGSHQPRIAELALQSGLPSMWRQSDAVGRGGLMAYGPNRASMFRRAAYYVDRILKGTPPADLPIEQPREFDFVINLRTAQALGLTIPHHVLLQATEVVQ